MKKWHLGLLLLVFTGSSLATPVYFNDFDDGTGLAGYGLVTSAQGLEGVGNISGNIWRNDAGLVDDGDPSTPDIAQGSGVQVFGMGDHDTVRVSFDLIAIDSWDGSSPTGGVVDPDFFNVVIDVGLEFSHTIDFVIQEDGSIFDSDADLLTHGGVSLHTNPLFSESAYHVILEVPHFYDDLTVVFFASGDGWQGGIDESWGMDNLLIESLGASAVPLPLPVFLLGMGLLALYPMSRRRGQ
ncbi:MAG: hypothetical protein AAF525_05265 [Pseudomonadota bacterium]